MAGGDEDTASVPTVADRPGLLGAQVAVPGEPPAANDARSDPPPTVGPSAPRGVEAGAPTALTTAADAMRDEELDRTRLFIRMGWAISFASIGSVPLLHAPRAMSIVFVAALALGILVSAWFHRAFADPARYTERALVILAVMCLVNSHVAVLYYGAFTVTPLIVVIGIHFVARTEAVRAARTIFATALGLYVLTVLPILSGVIADPGVFASDRPMSRGAELAGAAFVLATYTLAYVTARAFRGASLRAIEGLTRATRLASQRAALIDELRGDLERALRIGGPGRYSEQVIGGCRLGVVLGRGAMGEVYEAVQLATGAPAAVKLMRKELLGDPAHVARFVREARVSGALASPYVVRVLDAAAGDPPYLVMERLYGQTLAERLRQHGRLSGPALVELVRHVGAGLDAARAAGVIHRDIKPQNLVFDRVWKILDFGVATLAHDGGTLTQGGVIGTPSYMAPEQAQGKPLDERADLYALAAVAYRCVTGRHPFSGADTPALLYAVVHELPPRPGEASELPADVDRWFALGLAKSPEDRLPTGKALADALVDAFAGTLAAALRKRADQLLRTLPWR